MRASHGRIVAIACLGVALVASAWFTVPALVWGAEAKDKEEKVAVKDLMEDLGGAFRKLRRQVTTAGQNESTLQIIAAMETAAVKAKTLTPKPIADMPKDKQADAAKMFRLKMIDLGLGLLQAEKAVLEGRNGDAFEIVKKLDVMRDECHKPLGIKN